MPQRKDKKGRNLRTGEDQMPDGRYRYRYTVDGSQKAVYSWCLTAADKTPAGRRKSECLRDKEARIEADLRDEIDTCAAATLTLNDMHERYMAAKIDLRRSSRLQYESLYRNFVQDGLGRRKLRDIRYSDIKKLYYWMKYECGYRPRTVESVHNILHPIFGMAVRDALLRRNPTEGVLTEMRQSPNWVVERRHALTAEEQSAFMGFVSASPTYRKWLPLFTFLLGTGCRISEALGLRWENVDFRAGTVRIDHALSYLPNDAGRCEFHCSPTKTAASVRTIPMLQTVRAALNTQRRLQCEGGSATRTVDGWDDFVFTNGAGGVHCTVSVNQTIDRICDAYNRQEQRRAHLEHREAKPLPHFSVHSLRHSFCSRLCESESNVKIIQEIMGHSSIGTTMDIYAEISEARKHAAFYSMEGRVSVS